MATEVAKVASEFDEAVVDDPVVAEHGPFVLTSAGAHATKKATEQEWTEATEWCKSVEKSVGFWLGDLVIYGEQHFHETYSQILDATGYAEQTINNAMSVAKRIPRARRRPNVPFSHHAEIAPLTDAQQDELLNKCEAEDLTREQLRTLVAVKKAEKTGKTVSLWCVAEVQVSSVEEQTIMADQLRMLGCSVKLQTR